MPCEYDASPLDARRLRRGGMLVRVEKNPGCVGLRTFPPGREHLGLKKSLRETCHHTRTRTRTRPPFPIPVVSVTPLPGPTRLHHPNSNAANPTRPHSRCCPQSSTIPKSKSYPTAAAQTLEPPQMTDPLAAA